MNILNTGYSVEKKTFVRFGECLPSEGRKIFVRLHNDPRNMIMLGLWKKSKVLGYASAYPSEDGGVCMVFFPLPEDEWVYVPE